MEARNFEAVAIAGMTMRRLGEAEIETYLDQAGEAITSSVGAYQPFGEPLPLPVGEQFHDGGGGLLALRTWP